jgi:hypothetical protein
MAQYVYHYVFDKMNADSIKEHGLLSPRELLKKMPDEFHEKIYPSYKARAAKELGKPADKVTDKNVLQYLDSEAHDKNRLLGGKSLYFTFVPREQLHKDIRKKLKGCTEIKVPIEELKGATPYLVDGSKVRKQTWQQILDPQFQKNVRADAKLEPDGRFLFSKIPHLALNVGKISPDRLEINKMAVLARSAWHKAQAILNPGAAPILTTTLIKIPLNKLIQGAKS